MGVAGGALALWCILTFVFVGKGTPAPFDPPRYIRNPMYLGAGLALAGAALFRGSMALLGYTAVFLGLTHLFVVLYEEPALARLFGDEYRAYRTAVGRWLPAARAAEAS